MRKIAIICALTLAAPAAAQECALHNAIYTQAGSSYEIRFSPLDPQTHRAASTSHQFTIDAPDASPALSGDVIWNLGLSRPNGTIFIDCPADAMTTDDYAGCTIWEGVLYAGGEDGITVLPEAPDAPAPAQILLPDLARAFNYGVWDVDFVPGEIPEDVFDLSGCAG